MIHTLEVSGVVADFQFAKISPECAEFWAKLKKIGDQRFESLNFPTFCLVDKYTITFLTKVEWLLLSSELRAVLAERILRQQTSKDDCSL